MPSCEVELVVDAKAVIGESPAWAHGVLYWIDVKAPALYRTCIDSGRTLAWRLPSEIGGYALLEDGSGAVAGLRGGIFAINFESGEVAQLCEAPFDTSTHRFNESGCDDRGRLWLGTMFEPEPDIEADPVPDHLYSFSFDGGLIRHRGEALLYNGFAWRPGRPEFFMAHSRQGRIYACEYDADRGEVGERRVFATVPQERGIPDGGAFDDEGFYWSAIHGGGRLHRYAPDGRLDDVIQLPVQNPTMMAFCGPNLDVMCITSATHGKPGKPHEGGIFRLRPGVRGAFRQAHIDGSQPNHAG